MVEQIDPSDFLNEATSARQSLWDAGDILTTLAAGVSGDQARATQVGDVRSLLDQAEEQIFDGITFSEGLDPDVTAPMTAALTASRQAVAGWATLSDTATEAQGKVAAAALVPLVDATLEQVDAALSPFDV